MSSTTKESEKWCQCGICGFYVISSKYRRHVLLSHHQLENPSSSDNVIPKPSKYFHNIPCAVNLERKVFTYLTDSDDNSEDDDINCENEDETPSYQGIEEAEKSYENKTSSKEATEEIILPKAISKLPFKRKKRKNQVTSHIKTKRGYEKKKKRPKRNKPRKCVKCLVTFPSHTISLKHQVKCKIRPECKICHETFKSFSLLENHRISKHDLQPIHVAGLKVEEKVPCNICNIMVCAYGLQRHILAKHTGERPFKCDICCLKFPRQDQLKSHLRIHSDKKYYSCSQCDEKFKYSSSLNFHVDRVHTAEENRRKHFCNICKTDFVSRSKLLFHKRQDHAVWVKFECLFCERILPTSSSLENHYRIHTRETPFTCHTCGMEFNQSSNFRSHMTIHDTHYKKPHACDKCDRRFKDKTALAVHLKIHDGIKDIICQVCNKAFRSKMQVQMHIRSHLGDRPYKCKYCSKAFKNQVSVKIHEMLHRGEKPHVCEKCGKGYTQSVNMKNHRKNCKKGFNRKDKIYK